MTSEPVQCQDTPVCSATAAVFDRTTPVLMKEHHTPGVSAALVDDGKIVWAGCYGVGDAGSPTRETVFETCSMSKPLFAYAFLKPVEQGKFAIDTPLVDYLPMPYLKDQPLHTQITAGMVLTHTSAFPN